MSATSGSHPPTSAGEQSFVALVRSLPSQIRLAIGLRGVAWASIAGLIGIVCCLAAIADVAVSLRRSDIEHEHGQAKAVLELDNNIRQLMRSLFLKTSGTEFAPVEAMEPAWTTFRDSLETVCQKLDAVVNGQRLKSTCEDRAGFFARVGAQIAALDPPRTTLSPPVFRELLEVRDNINGVATAESRRIDSLVGHLVKDYALAIVVLTLSTLGFVGAGLVLILLVGWAALKFHRQWQETHEARDQLQETIQARVELTNKLEQQIVDSEQARDDYQSLVDSLTDVVLKMDAEDGTITFASANAQELLHVSADKLMGTRVIDYVVPEDLDYAIRTTIEALRGPSNEVKQMQYRVQTPGMEARHVEVRFRKLRRTAEGKKLVVTVVRDIEERMRLERQRRDSEQVLAHAERLATIGEMAGTVAHEISQPLQVMNLAAQSALEEIKDSIEQNSPPNSEFVLQKLHRIVAQIERASQIVANMRDFVRGTTSEIARPFEPLQAIHSAVALTQYGTKQTGASVSVTTEPDLPLVKGHQTRLEQVIVNLINNARDAGAQNIELSASRTTLDRVNWVRLLIEDTGPGIPDKVLAKLFVDFVTTKPPGKGTGLGLRICRRIVEEMGGQIRASNRPVGGACFEILLPGMA